MNQWDRVYLAPEFPIILCFSAVVLLFLLLRVIDVINNRKSRKYLGKLAFFFDEQGDNAMKNLLDTLANAVEEGHKTPLIAHNDARARNLGEAIKRTMQQGNQVGALVGQLAVLSGVNKASSELKDLNDALEGNVAGAQKAFDDATPSYIQATLMAQQQPEQLTSVEEGTTAKELSAPAEVPAPVEAAEVAPPVEASSEDRAPAEGVNLTLVQSTSDTPSGEEVVIDPEEAVILEKISNFSHLHGYNLKPSGKNSLMDLSTSSFTDLFAHFRGKSSCTGALDEEKEIFAYLERVKARRNEAKMQKVG